MRSRTARNSLALLVSQAATTLVTALMLPLLTRHLGRADYGLYTSIYAFVGTFGVLSDVGINVILNREIAQNQDRSARLLGQTLVLKALLTGVFLLVVMGASIPRDFGPLKWLLLTICALESGVRTYSNTMIATFRAHGVMVYETLITLLDRGSWVIGLLLVILLDGGLVSVFLVFLVAALTRFVAVAVICWMRVVRPQFGVNLEWWRFMLGESWPIGVAQGARKAYDRIGIVQLDAARGSDIVGLFSGPNRVYQLTNSLAASVPNALFPEMAAAAQVSTARLRWITMSGLKVLLITTLPLAGFYVMFAADFVRLFLGPEFEGAGLAVQILAPAVVLAAINGLLQALLRANGRQQYDLFCMLGALAVNFGANLVLIPRLGYVGPAVGVLVAQGVQLALAMGGTLSIFRRVPLRALIAPFLSGFAMLGVWWLTASLHVLIRVPVGVLVYGVVLYSLGGIDKGVVQVLRAAISRRAGSTGDTLHDGEPSRD